MKKTIFENQKMKRILGCLFGCLAFGLVVYAANVFINFREDGQDPQLRQATWNDVMEQLEILKSDLASKITAGKVPAGTVMIFDGGVCPPKWKPWEVSDDDANRLLLPKIPGYAVEGGTGYITLEAKNIPKHYHKIIGNVNSDTQGDAGNALAVGNNTSLGYRDYSLKGTTISPTMGKTSEEGVGKPIKGVMPKYKRVLFCIKYEEG